jgi:hypothetical protein
MKPTPKAFLRHGGQAERPAPLRSKLACLPPHRAMAYLYLVRSRANSLEHDIGDYDPGSHDALARSCRFDLSTTLKKFISCETLSEVEWQTNPGKRASPSPVSCWIPGFQICPLACFLSNYFSDLSAVKLAGGFPAPDSPR